MARSKDLEQGRFDIHQFMGVDELPALVPPQEERHDMPEEQAQPHVPDMPTSQPPRQKRQSLPDLTPLIPVSYDDEIAWKRREAELKQPKQLPQLPGRALSPGGLFTPALPPASRPAQHAIAAAPGAASSVEVPGGTPHSPDVPSTAPGTNTGVDTGAGKSKPFAKALEVVRKRPKLAMGVGGALLAGVVVGGPASGVLNSLEGESPMQAMAMYPGIRNEAINCGTVATMLSFESNAVVKIPLKLSETGQHTAYMTMNVNLSNIPVAVNMCGVRNQNVPETLATYDKDSKTYHFDRKKVNLTVTEKSFNTSNKGANATISQPTGVYLDGKALTAAEIPKHPFNKATTDMLKTLMSQDAKTQAITYTSQMSRLVLVKMEADSLKALDDPKVCAATQATADQATSAYISDQVARRSSDAKTAAEVSSVGSNSYGSLTSSYMSNKETANFANSNILSLVNFALTSCDANLVKPLEAPASPTTNQSVTPTKKG
jgi:hypothetical protein